MGTKKKSTDAAAPEAATQTEEQKPKTAEVAIDEALSAVANPKRKGKAKGAKASDLTLHDLAERYIARLEEDGKSQGTLFSYRMEARLLLDALGEETPAAKVKPTAVQAFFVSDRVLRTRTGVEKSPLSVAKTRRVAIQLFKFAEEIGVVEKAPLPEEPAKA